MGEEQQALYDHLSGQLRKEVENKIEQIGINKAHLDILAALTKLRQICCDPELLKSPEGTNVPDSAKLELFEELLREALDSGRTVIVFSQFVEMQKRIIKVIKKLGVDPCWLHGGTRERDKVVARFQDPEGPPVIVVSLRAGGTGLTLTRADTVIHYDPWWNPAVERQATDRAHRLGQTQTVNVYKLVCAGTIEERVLELAERKEHLAREILGSEGTSDSKRITTTDVLALLR
jgi:SNF2 family DNA or RNA helicase